MGTSLFRLLATLLAVFVGILVLSLPFIIATRRLPAPLSGPVVLVDSVSTPAGSVPPDSLKVWAALSSVRDPELKIGIADLGLVRHALVSDSGDVDVLMGLTRPTCPFGAGMAERTMAALRALPGIRRIRVRLDPGLTWDPSLVSPAARDRYRRFFSSDTSRSR